MTLFNAMVSVVRPTVAEMVVAVGRVTVTPFEKHDAVSDGGLPICMFVGKTVMNILEGSADPQAFIPRMIELWKQGRFPFDRLIEQFPMSAINEAEASSLQGGAIKPVLRP